MGVLTNIWDFFKKHWQAILLVVIVVGGYAWIRSQQSTFATTLQQIDASHQVEIDQINKARADEKAQHEAQLEHLQQSLERIQQDYVQAQAAIIAAQTVQQKQIVQKFGNDSVGLANLLAEKFNFVVVLPPTQ